MSNVFFYITSKPYDKLEGSKKAMSTPYITTTLVGDEYKSLM